MTYIPAAEYPQPIAQFCFKHGLKELSSCSMHPLKGTETHAMGGEFHLLQTCYTGNTAVTRLHRSLENLHWTSISDAAVYSHFRSGDSDFILQCRQPRFKSGEGTLAHSMAEISESAMERATVHKDLARPPIYKVQQWLLPTGDNKASSGGAKRDLKEKLRTHSSKIAEPHRPVRPLTCLSSHTEEQHPLQQHISSVPCIPALTNSTMPVTRQCTSTFHYRTSHEYIKQEAFRRLQLRRQNSSPNLTLHQGEKENRGMVKSKTSESFREQRQGCGKEWEIGVQERKHSNHNRLYIPTFEEFKKMRNKEKVHPSDTDTKYFSNGESEPENTIDGSLLTKKDSPVQRLDIWPGPSVSHGNLGPVGAVNFNGLSEDNCVSKVMQNSKRLSTGDFYSVVVQKSADLSTRNCNSSGLSNSNHTSMEAQNSSEFSKGNQDLFSTGKQDSMVAHKSTNLSPVDFYSMVVQKSAGLSSRNHVQNSTGISTGGLSTGFSSGNFDSMLMHKYTSFSTRNCLSTSVQSSSDLFTRNHVSKEVQSPTGLSTEDCDSRMLQNATENHDTLVVKKSTYLFPTNHNSVLVQNSPAQSTGNEDSVVGQHFTDLSSESYDSTVVQKPTGLSTGNETSMVEQDLTGLSTGSHDFVVMQNSAGLSMGNDDSMAVQNSSGLSIGSHDSTDCMNKVSHGLSHGHNGSIQESTFVLSVMNVDLHQIKPHSGGSGNSSRAPLIAQHDSLEAKGHSTTYSSAFPAPICSSPSPRFPLQSVTLPRDKGELVGYEPFVSNGNSSSRFPNIAGQCITSEPPSCCPSLLLEATDLSGYSAKLQKMKDGLIGSALDLIKKSCSAESTVESPTKVSSDLQRTDLSSPEKSNRSSPDTMATPNSATVGSNEMGADTTQSLSGSACRRSSSDMTHETVETGKTPRGCRLRPHFSDPMPTDAVKRKQLELKIAAAARHHAQRRRQDKDNGPVLMKANTTTSCISEKETNLNAGQRHRSRHRWSNISSLSTDSGIVGVNDEKEEGELTMGRATNPAEVERADSGIGDAFSRRWRTRVAEASASLEAWEAHRPCTDCGERDLGVDTENRGKRRETLCTKCLMHRMERKEAIMEFVNTEASYGEDLKIIKEEFYIPMQSAGLLTHEQLLVIFTNVQELICLNEKFVEVLQEEIDQAFDQGDDDLITVCLGEVFLEFVNMLPAFQTYCLQHSASVTLLNALEKEKELLRIFLDVSQNDNTALRRMNLRSFLITPLQRVTKYPLLLTRILKSTTEFHPDHSSLWEAKSRIESHLEHINMKTKQEGNSWTIRSFRRESKRTREATNIELKELAIKQVGWPREDTRFIKEGALQLAQPTDGQWIKKGCKALKFQNVQALLMVNIRRVSVSESSLEASAAENPTVRDAVLVLIKDKSNGKFVLFREPLKLSNCVVSVDPDCDDTFELLEIRRDGLVLRDGDISRTHHWYQQLKIYSGWLGTWKRRRNALPNIMISTTQSRS